MSGLSASMLAALLRVELGEASPADVLRRLADIARDSRRRLVTSPSG